MASQAAAYFKTDETAVNWFSTCFVFANVVVAPAVIYALHLGPKLSILTSAALLLVGNWLRYAGCHSSESGIFGLVMFGQILTGAAQAFVLAAPTRYSDMWFTNRGRVGATALASLANPLGAALSQLIIPFWVQDANDVSSMVLYVSIIVRPPPPPLPSPPQLTPHQGNRLRPPRVLHPLPPPHARRPLLRNPETLPPRLGPRPRLAPRVLASLLPLRRLRGPL